MMHHEKFTNGSVLAIIIPEATMRGMQKICHSQYMAIFAELLTQSLNSTNFKDVILIFMQNQLALVL